MKLSKEIKAAIIVISGIVLFILGINFLMGKNLLGHSRTYYVVFNHSGGLQNSTPVTVNGKQIGKVTDVTLRQEDAKIVVTFEVDNDYEFSKNSRAELFKSLLGNPGLQVIPALDGAPNAESGDTLTSTIQPDMMESLTGELTPIKIKLENALTGIDSLLHSLNDVLDEPRRERLRTTIEDLGEVVANFKVASSKLNVILETNGSKLSASLDSVQVMTGNLAKISEDIANSDIQGSLEKFNSAMTKLDNVMASIENGEGNIGKLLKDEEMYNNLEGATQQLEQLLQDFRLNPKRYVHFSLFGKKNKDYTPPADEKM